MFRCKTLRYKIYKNKLVKFFVNKNKTSNFAKLFSQIKQSKLVINK